MSAVKCKGPVFEAGVCRCCGSVKRCRVLNVQYEFCGHPEVYSDMFMDCYGLLLSHLDGDPIERLICATCVCRLREADSFRKQALLWEEKLLQSKIHVDEVKTEKVEICRDDDGYNLNNFNDDLNTGEVDNLYDDAVEDSDIEDNKPLKKLKKKMSKLEKKEKSLHKVKRKAKKQDKTDAKLMLDSILKMKETLVTMGVSSEQLEPEYEAIEKPANKKIVDNEHKMFSNVSALVENSYVCPFDACYSDYYCFYCREIFTDPNKLREHTLTHDPSNFQESYTKKMAQIDITRIDCRLCPQIITDIDSFKAHATNSHGIFFYADVNNEFLRYRLTPTNLTCTECKSTFSFFHALKKHMAEHFGTCVCDVCGAHYFEERMLLIHQKTHQKLEKDYPCKDCDKVFKSKHSRYLHIAKMHKKEPTYQCSKCDEVFFSYSIRYRHLIDVHNEQRTFQCEHCDKTYDSRKSLREHTRRYHLKIFKHQCDLCDKRFYLPSRLKEHMVTHTGERNFRCQYCGKSYPRMRGLKVHMQSHSADKKFKCMLCNASFTQNVNLKNHMKRQHQNMDVEDGFHE